MTGDSESSFTGLSSTYLLANRSFLCCQSLEASLILEQISRFRKPFSSQDTHKGYMGPASGTPSSGSLLLKGKEFWFSLGQRHIPQKKSGMLLDRDRLSGNRALPSGREENSLFFRYGPPLIPGLFWLQGSKNPGLFLFSGRQFLALMPGRELYSLYLETPDRSLLRSILDASWNRGTGEGRWLTLWSPEKIPATAHLELKHRGDPDGYGDEGESFRTSGEFTFRWNDLSLAGSAAQRDHTRLHAVGSALSFSGGGFTAGVRLRSYGAHDRKRSAYGRERGLAIMTGFETDPLKLRLHLERRDEGSVWAELLLEASLGPAELFCGGSLRTGKRPSSPLSFVFWSDESPRNTGPIFVKEGDGLFVLRLKSEVLQISFFSVLVDGSWKSRHTLQITLLHAF